MFLLSLNSFGSDFEDEFADEFSDELQNKTLFDPLSSYNRFMTDINDVIIINIFDPIAEGYKFIAPKPVRESIDNFFSNLYYPVSFSNNLLQLKFKYAMDETFRFLTNTSLGLFGLFDVGKSWFEVEPHVEDFGQTLGHYGVGSGFPIVIPLFGQSNLRDFSAGFVDVYANPRFWYTQTIDDNMVSYATYLGIRSYKSINSYSLSPASYEDITKHAFDLYPFLTNMYEQNRNKLIEE
jgi:phospholipid-binding lipoprotein MlaA